MWGLGGSDGSQDWVRGETSRQRQNNDPAEKRKAEVAAARTLRLPLQVKGPEERCHKPSMPCGVEIVDSDP